MLGLGWWWEGLLHTKVLLEDRPEKAGWAWKATQLLTQLGENDFQDLNG